MFNQNPQHNKCFELIDSEIQSVHCFIVEILLFTEPLDKRDIFVVGTKVRELALKYDFRNRNYESVEDELSESEKESPSFLQKTLDVCKQDNHPSFYQLFHRDC